jgi:hypothetical protein
MAALSGTRPDNVNTGLFSAARAEIYDAYTRRGCPEAGRNIRSIFHRLQLTLFHAGKIDSLARPPTKPPVSITGWDPITPRYRDAAFCYVEQVRLSLRPATVKHIEQHLRVFGTWLADHHPDVATFPAPRRTIRRRRLPSSLLIGRNSTDRDTTHHRLADVPRIVNIARESKHLPNQPSEKGH